MVHTKLDETVYTEHCKHFPIPVILFHLYEQKQCYPPFMHSSVMGFNHAVCYDMKMTVDESNLSNLTWDSSVTQHLASVPTFWLDNKTSISDDNVDCLPLGPETGH